MSGADTVPLQQASVNTDNETDEEEQEVISMYEAVPPIT
jgi:hypothetical protein